MPHKRLSIALGVFAGCSLGLTALLLAAAAGSAFGQVKSHTSAKVTVVTVTLGKPAELGIKLSRSSALPAGLVTFKVTNKGAITHNFKICTSRSATAPNSCAGKVTSMLKPGKTATLTVSLTKTGKYGYLCTVPGHASAGMKGLLGVGVKVTPTPVVASPTPTTTTTPTPTTTTTPATAGATCASPQSTTVTVGEFDFGFTLSQSSAPCGKVTFVMTNTGQTVHDFVMPGVMNGGRLQPGQSATVAATVSPGTFSFLCTVEGHDSLGMVGKFTAT